MTLYMDASAIVKRYAREAGTEVVLAAYRDYPSVATAMISAAEVPAALAKAVRVGAMTEAGAAEAVSAFQLHWPDHVRINLTEDLAVRAGELAWSFGLRGYDSVQLASALAYSQTRAEQVTLMTFDRQLWQAARQAGLSVLPTELSQAHTSAT